MNDTTPVSGLDEHGSELAKAFAALVELVLSVPGAERVVADLGHALLSTVAATVQLGQQSEQPQEHDVRAMVRSALERQQNGAQQEEPPAVEVAQGQYTFTPSVNPAQERLQFHIDTVQELAAVFRAKSRAAEWSAEARRRGLVNAGQPPPEVSIAIEGADERLWMCKTELVHRFNDETWERLQTACSNVAEVLDFLRIVMLTKPIEQGRLAEALRFVAEAQAIVRTVFFVVRDSPDPDQALVHSLLRDLTREFRVYIPKFMKLNDTPSTLEEESFPQRLVAAYSILRDRQQQEKMIYEARTSLYDNLSYIQESQQKDIVGYWLLVYDSIETLITVGAIQPSNKDLRTALLPLLEWRPEGLMPGPGVSQVLREIDRYLESQEASADQNTAPPRLTPEVRAVSSLLRGQQIVLIGGNRRVEHEERLVEAFELSGITWLEGFDHSHTDYEKDITRKEVALVLLAIRWASHEAGAVRQYCQAHGKPLVLLPAGYNANQVAVQILEQAGERLRARAES